MLLISTLIDFSILLVTTVDISICLLCLSFCLFSLYMHIYVCQSYFPICLLSVWYVILYLYHLLYISLPYISRQSLRLCLSSQLSICLSVACIHIFVFYIYLCIFCLSLDEMRFIIQNHVHHLSKPAFTAYNRQINR